ncbi:MAG: oligosaccharide flippase family protein [Betaproteobacteria bacterium]|jgi:PST family polysaccharide transporter
MSRLTANLSWLYGLHALNLLLPLLSVPFLTRTLHVDGFGRLAFALAIAQYITLVTDYGFNLSATRRAAQLLAAQAPIDEFFWQTQWTKASLGLLSVAALLVVVAVARPQDPAILLAAAIAAPSSIILPGWYCQAIQRMGLLAACTLAARVTCLALLFVLVEGPDDVAVAVLLSAGVPLLAGLIAWPLLWNSALSLRLPTVSGVVRGLREGWSLFLSSAAVGACISSAVPILRLFTDDRTVGLYAAAEKLIRAAQTATVPVSQAAFPHVNTLFVQSPVAALAFLRRLAGWLALAGLLVSLTCLLLAQPVVTLLFGPAFADAALFLIVLAPVPLIAALGDLLGTQTLLTFGHHRTYTQVVVASTGLFFVLALILAWQFTGVGMALAVLATEAATTVAMLLAVQRRGIALLGKSKS